MTIVIPVHTMIMCSMVSLLVLVGRGRVVDAEGCREMDRIEQTVVTKQRPKDHLPCQPSVRVPSAGCDGNEKRGAREVPNSVCHKTNEPCCWNGTTQDDDWDHHDDNNNDNDNNNNNDNNEKHHHSNDERRTIG